MKLKSASHCDKSLAFQIFQTWPPALPGVSVNGVLVAGFQQDWIFDHEISWNESEQIAALFRSLYFDLSFVEAANLLSAAEFWNLDVKHSAQQFPIAEVLKKFGWQLNDNFRKTSERLRQTSIHFQNWCFEKKINVMDLAPLLSITNDQLLDPRLLTIFNALVDYGFSKTLGVQFLELGIELFLLNPDEPTAIIQSIIPKNKNITMDTIIDPANKVDPVLRVDKVAEKLLEAFKKARYPMTYQQDEAHQQKWQKISWPSQAQVRFTRHGDKAGVEMRLFVSQASDLKKYLVSLERAYQILENETLTSTEH